MRWYLFLIAICSFAAWRLGPMHLYNAETGIGYLFGLVGGAMMLTLLFYPLSKRIRILRTLIPLKHWFRMHMLLGVFGPLLIFFHSNFHFGSVNGSVAFFSMLAVFLSGLVGRFIYTRIHHGLYGRRASLDELRTQLVSDAEGVAGMLSFAPVVQARLQRFERSRLSSWGGILGGTWRFLTLAPAVWWAGWRTRGPLRRALRDIARQRKWERAKYRKRLRTARGLVRHHIRSVRSVAQYRVYESMFSLWHVLHVPLMFLLVATAIIHVVVVHMY